MNPSPFSHPTYTSAQITAYFTRILLPRAFYEIYCDLYSGGRSIGSNSNALSFLTALQQHHITAIPFENLDLHYSFHHAAPVTPEDVFEKIVTRGTGRGGWCLQMNYLFGTVLRSLGYELFTTAGRVSTAVDTISASKGPARYNNVYVSAYHVLL